MTDAVGPDTEAESWGEDAPEMGVTMRATFPEYPYKLADHVYTWSPKLPDGSMMVIRSQTAEGLAEAAEAVAAVAQRLGAAWRAATGAPQAPAPVPQGQFPGAAPQQFNQQPAQPFPNQPFPGQPAWRQAGTPQGGGQQWGGGGAQQGQRKEYPAPQGWYRISGQKAQVDGIAGQFGIPKGNPNKGGKYNFFGLTPSGEAGKSWYCAPEVAQAFAQLNPVPA